jgi:hypothetical protein
MKKKKIIASLGIKDVLSLTSVATIATVSEMK